MEIQKITSTHNTTYIGNRTVKYIVIHYTAGSTSKAGSAVNNAINFSVRPEEASADFIVDDSAAVQYNPDIKKYYTWHCGDAKEYTKGGSLYGKCTNANSIGIELCSTNPTWKLTDPANIAKWSFTQNVVDNAVELTKQLMKTYGVPAERVVRHYDVSGKLCPGIIGWNADSGSELKWIEFKKRIGDISVTPLKPTDTGILYRVRKSPYNAKSQIGAWKNLDSAKAQADKNSGYCVYDTAGRLIYAPTSTKKSVGEIAHEVIQGKWGNGEERKKRLTDAGYSYTAVQAEVNKILK